MKRFRARVREGKNPSMSLRGLHREGGRVLKAWLPLLLIACLSCSAFTPASSRKEGLSAALKHMHLHLVAQERSGIVRYISGEDAKRWDAGFQCLFLRFRILEILVDDVRFEEKARRAIVMVRIEGHVVDTLSMEQALLEEIWEYEDGAWRMQPESDMLTHLLAGCYPKSQGRG